MAENLEKRAERITNLKLSGNKLAYHREILSKWKNNEAFPPIYILFGPTSYCNHKCVHCYVQDEVQKPISISEEVYLRFAKEIGEYGVKALVLEGCGEPLFHKTTIKAIETAVKSGTDVGILTNGVLIKEKDIPSLMENLTYMRFSVSGGSYESYSFIHGCPPHDWDKVRNNMRKCVDYRDKNNSKCTLGAYTLMSDKNINEIEDWVKEVKDMGFDYITIKPPAPGLNHVVYVKQSELERCEPMFDRISKMSDNRFKVEIRRDLFEKKGGCERDYGQCFGLPFMCAIDSDGSVYACNWFWGNKDFCYGNINEKTFSEIWEGDRKKELIKRISSEDFDFGSCGECRQNSINKFLWDLKRNTGLFRLIDDAKAWEEANHLSMNHPPVHINFI
jgi:GTP 3',8-cyclase